MTDLVFVSLLSHAFTVSRKIRLPDDQGGWQETWGEIGSIQGRLRPLTAQERTVADQRQARVTHVLYTLADADVRRGDLVEGADNRVEVVAVREPSHSGEHLEIDCRETQLEATTWPSS